MKRAHFPHLRAIAVAFAVLCGLVTIAMFGEVLPSSPFGRIPFEVPIEADSSGSHTAVVDRESRRVLILNADFEITGIVNCDKLNSPIEAITDVCVAKDGVYVAGVKYQKDSDIIECERVVVYGTHGKSEKVVYERIVEAENTPSIKALDNADSGGVYIALFDDELYGMSTSTMQLIYANRSESFEVEGLETDYTQVYDIGYSSKAKAIATISMRGILNDDWGSSSTEDQSASVTTDVALAKHDTNRSSWSDCVFTSVDMSDDGDVYLYDDVSGSICRIDDAGKLKHLEGGEGCSSLHANGYKLAACNLEHGAVVIMGLDDESCTTLKEAGVSQSLAVLTCVTYACRLYVALYIVVVLLRKAWQLAAQGDLGKIGPLFGSAAVVFVVALAIGYISYGTYQSMMQTRTKEINTFADYLQDIALTQLSESMQKCNDRDFIRNEGASSKEAREGITDIEVDVIGLSYDATFNGLGTYTTVYGMDDKGVFYLIGSSEGQVIGTSAGAAAKADEIGEVFESGEVDRKIRTGSTLRDATLYRLVRIPSPDEQETVGVIEIGSRLRTFSASVAKDQVQRTIALLVMVLVVYLTYAELVACAKCFEEFRLLHHHHDSIAVLTRPFSFFVTLLASIDSVMTALIARALLSSAGMQTSGFYLALPAVMAGIGLAIGQVVYGIIGSRVLIHKLMMRGAIVMVAAALFAAGVVWMENYWLYCLAKLFMAAPFGLLYTLSYSLPRRADTDEVRATAAAGIKRTDTSAAALGTVLGGYAAQTLGNAWVYVLVAVVSAIVVVMADRVLPSTRHPMEHEARSVRSRTEAIVKLLTSKTTLPVIFFVMLPAILAAGYNSFLFPLFSANLGIGTSSINNLAVLGQLVVYVSISGIEWLEGRYDKWWLALAAVSLLGVVFLLFSFNTTIVWAVVTIALVGLLCKTSDAWKALWPRSAKADGLHTGMAVGAMFGVRSILLIVQPLLLGALLSLGDQSAVIVLGCICSVCAIAFFFVTRKMPLAPESEQTS